MGGATKVSLFSHTDSGLDSDGISHVNTYTLKGARGNNSKDTFDSVSHFTACCPTK